MFKWILFLVTQQYDFESKTPKAPSQSTKPVEVPQATPAGDTASAAATTTQPEEKDKKEKKKKPAKEG